MYICITIRNKLLKLNIMTTENKLTLVIETLVSQAVNGVTMKNIRRGLEFKNLPSELINKLMRIVELELNTKGC